MYSVSQMMLCIACVQPFPSQAMLCKTLVHSWALRFDPNNGYVGDKEAVNRWLFHLLHLWYIEILRRPRVKNPNEGLLLHKEPLESVIPGQSRYWESIPGAERDWLKRFPSIPILAERRPRAERASNPVSPASCLSVPSGCRNLLPVWSLAGWEFDAVSRGTVIAGHPVKWLPAGGGGRRLSWSTGLGTMKT